MDLRFSPCFVSSALACWLAFPLALLRRVCVGSGLGNAMGTPWLVLRRVSLFSGERRGYWDSLDTTFGNTAFLVFLIPLFSLLSLHGRIYTT